MTDAGSGRVRRAGVVVADQAVAGTCNVLASVLAALTVSVEAFGKFELIFLVFAFVQASARSLVAEPLLVHPKEVDASPIAALRSGQLVGLAAGVLVAAFGGVAWLLGDDEFGLSLLILAVLLPIFVFQDLFRFLSFALRTPGFALVVDTTWLVAMILFVVVADHLTTMTLPLLVAAWAGAGAVAALPGFIRFRWLPTGASTEWLRTTWPFAWRYLATSGAANGTALLSGFVLAGICGAAVVGAVRGAQLLLRPYLTFQTAIVTSGTADSARTASAGPELARQANRLTLVMVGVAVVLGTLYLTLPTAVGERLLGDTWAHAEPLLPAAACQMFLLGLWTGPRACLLGARRVRTTFWLSVTLAPLLVPLGAVGAVIGGAVGFYWGLNLAQLVITVAWWWSFRRVTRSMRAAEATSPGHSDG